MKTKNLFFLLLAIGLIFIPGCIKNEESAGVLAMREAQASYINAKASYEDALAKAVLADVEYQTLMNRAQAIENKLKAVEDSLEIIKIEAELQVLLLQIEKNKIDAQKALDLAVVSAQIQLNNAEIDLKNSIRALEDQIAKSKISNPTLERYLSEYKDVVDEIINLQELIVNKEYQLTMRQLFQNGSPKAAIEKQKATLENQKAMMEKWLVKYKTAANDPSVIETELLKAAEERDANNAQRQIKNQQIEKQQKKLFEANNLRQSTVTTLQEAYNDYNEALGFQNSYDFFMNPDMPNNATSFISNTIINAINKELDASQGFYNTIAFYDAIINNASSTQAQKDNAVKNKDVVVKAVAYFRTKIGGTSVPAGVTTKKNAYFTAKSAFDAADESYINEQEILSDLINEINLLSSENSYLNSYFNLLQNQYSTINNEIQNLESNIINLSTNIQQLEAVGDEWESLTDILESEIQSLKYELSVLEKHRSELKAMIDAELQVTE
jgi:chromosome segregation ATPase